MQTLCVMMVLISMVAAPVSLIVWLVKKLRKKPTKTVKRVLLASVVCFVVFSVAGAMTAERCEHEYELTEAVEATCEEDGHETYRCTLCEREKTEKLKKLGHDMVEARRVEPTYDADGEYVERCSRCGYEEVQVLEKLVRETTEETETQTESNTEPEVEEEPKAEEESHEVSDAAQMVLAQIAEDMAKQVAKNPSTVKMSIFSQGFYKDGHTYAVQSDFSCSNLMGVSETHTIKVVAVSNEDESKISPMEVYYDGELIWVRDE